MRTIALIAGLAMILPALPGASAAVAAPGQAKATSCDSPRSNFDSLYCERKIFMQADTDLNTAYKALRVQLKAADRTTLLQSQRAWIRQRDEKCGRSTESAIGVDLVCAKDVTIARTNWLNDRTRECRSAGCRASLLDE
ncbi:lysozyme inhibitor LprI family protein [soil metagenome]